MNSSFPIAPTRSRSAPTPKLRYQPRFPTAPADHNSSCAERTRPEYVLNNLTSIFQAQPEFRSPQQYMEQFTDDFVFIPDDEDMQLNPTIYNADRDTLWGATEERNFARIILSQERIQSAHFIRWFKSALDERIPGRRRAARDLHLPLRSPSSSR